ncbi:MAG: endopeptidase La [Ignavibacteriales bacterium]|nr:endopeptidase La [Ignavibacteriales bacterium]
MPEDTIVLSEQEQTVVEDIPEILPVLPLRDIILFPYMMYPVLIGREQSINAANAAIHSKKYIFLAAQKKSNIDNPKAVDIHREGTVAKIVQILKMPNGLMKILVDGLVQGRIVDFTGNPDFFEAKIEIVLPQISNDHEMSALIRQMSSLFKEYVKINRNTPQDALNVFDSIDEPDRKLYYAAANIVQSMDIKQVILQKSTLKEQYYEIINVLNSEIDILKIEKEIDSKVQENIAKSQRRFIIQEQIKILQNELGEDEDESPETQKIADKIKKIKMPKLAHAKAMEEVNKLRKIPQMSPEYTVIRNYLDWMVALPWTKRSKDNLNIKHVKGILDEDHYGLEKPKDRILEHIAVLNLVKNMRGQILCFVGPPGVGKTSLAKSIARALGREFIRISLGGVRDEAEIRGHRRTYIGSLPGKILQSMKRAGTINPVILLDEIDKLSSDFRGDPSSAMLEVLDPEQNHTFQDHYLEVDYDLSQVMFITTANVRYNIPLPLQDRMEIIELTSYLELDKIEIAKKHIIPKQLIQNGLNLYNILLDDSGIKAIIRGFTREAGVRNLEREVAALLRKIAREIVQGGKTKKLKNPPQILVNSDRVENLLGVPKYKSHVPHKDNQIGSVFGLAWTSVGGELLTVDVSIMKGVEKFLLTGQLGDVMKESAMAALSYIRSNAKHFGLPEGFYRGKEIHIHLPEGAIPKDGPSAGITLTMALLSAFKGVPASSAIAMTGEITLRGNVLPIGGLTEKLLAAKRGHIATVLIPKENEADLREIPGNIKDGLKIVPIEKIEDALSYVFPKMIVKRKPSGKKLK